LLCEELFEFVGRHEFVSWPRYLYSSALLTFEAARMDIMVIPRARLAAGP
jgi:hypothetical protein